MGGRTLAFVLLLGTAAEAFFFSAGQQCGCPPPPPCGCPSPGAPPPPPQYSSPPSYSAYAAPSSPQYSPTLYQQPHPQQSYVVPPLPASLHAEILGDPVPNPVAPSYGQVGGPQLVQNYAPNSPVVSQSNYEVPPPPQYSGPPPSLPLPVYSSPSIASSNYAAALQQTHGYVDAAQYNSPSQAFNQPPPQSSSSYSSPVGVTTIQTQQSLPSYETGPVIGAPQSNQNAYAQTDASVSSAQYARVAGKQGPYAQPPPVADQIIAETVADPLPLPSTPPPPPPVEVNAAPAPEHVPTNIVQIVEASAPSADLTPSVAQKDAPIETVDTSLSHPSSDLLASSDAAEVSQSVADLMTTEDFDEALRQAAAVLPPEMLDMVAIPVVSVHPVTESTVVAGESSFQGSTPSDVDNILEDAQTEILDNADALVDKAENRKEVVPSQLVDNTIVEESQPLSPRTTLSPSREDSELVEVPEVVTPLPLAPPDVPLPSSRHREVMATREQILRREGFGKARV